MTPADDRSISPAEAAAASICWLARWRARGVTDAATVMQRAAERHGESCRWCRIGDDELLAIIRRPLDSRAVEAFSKLPSGAQYARVREAQEGAWWDDLVPIEPAKAS